MTSPKAVKELESVSGPHYKGGIEKHEVAATSNTVLQDSEGSHICSGDRVPDQWMSWRRGCMV